jgi:hypothetical protein
MQPNRTVVAKSTTAVRDASYFRASCEIVPVFRRCFTGRFVVAAGIADIFDIIGQ